MSVVIKAFLEKAIGEPEIRRFTIEKLIAASYDQLVQKLLQVFPTLGKEFKTQWKDVDNDFIAFSSDTELAEALSAITDGVFRIYIRQDTDSSPSSQAFHPGVICDGCRGPIYGIRLKCAVCSDFDLCWKCKSADKHNEHAMMMVHTPEQLKQLEEQSFHRPPPPHHGPPFGGPPPYHFGPPGGWMWKKMFKKFMRHHWMDQWERSGDGPPQRGGMAGRGRGASPMHRQMSTDTDKDSNASSSKGKKDGNVSSGDEESPAENCLKNSGEFVSSMLDPLGVDVEVDYEHKGRRHCRRGRHGPWGFHGRGGGWRHHQKGPWRGWGPFRGPWPPWAGGPWEEEHDANHPGPSGSKPPGPESMETEGDAKEDVGMAEGHEDGWTVIPSSKDAKLQKSDECKYHETLKQLSAMGFKDNGGKLSRLVQEKNGNISEVLNVIQATGKSGKKS